MINKEIDNLVLSKFGSKLDKGGYPYIGHLLRVSDNARKLYLDQYDNTEDADNIELTGYLHDIIEDTDITADDLFEYGVPSSVVAGILSVTRQEGESYSEFIRRAAENPYGRFVKLADLKDNMDITRLQKLDKEDFDRLKKYLKAYHQLIESSFS